MSAEIYKLPTKVERLAEIVAEVRQVLATVSSATLEGYIKIGTRLVEAKDLVDHGKFIPWLRENFHTNYRQANKYMLAARNAADLRTNVHSNAHFKLDAISRMLKDDNSPPRPYKPRARKPDAKIEKALEALRAAGSAGMAPTEMARAGGLPTPAGLDRELSRGTAVRHAGRYYAPESAPNQTLPELSLTAQEKLDAWKRKLEADFEYRVKVEVDKRLEELHIPQYRKRIYELTRLLESPRNAVMTKREYNVILMCVHPDGASRNKEDLEEAFRLFTKYKVKMYSDEASRTEVLRTLPATYEEMMARRTKK